MDGLAAGSTALGSSVGNLSAGIRVSLSVQFSVVRCQDGDREGNGRRDQDSGSGEKLEVGTVCGFCEEVKLVFLFQLCCDQSTYHDMPEHQMQLHRQATGAQSRLLQRQKLCATA